MKPDMRKPMTNSADSRARAVQRAQEIREGIGSLDEGTDEFFVDQTKIPSDWTYEWKRNSVFGQEDSAHQIELARKGWEPVPASRHPEMMPVGHKGELIERKGMVLMERPREITEEVRAIEHRKAIGQVRMKEAQLAESPAGQFERANKDSSLVKVKRGYEPMPIPSE